MPVQQSRVLTDDDLTDADRKILEVLQRGARTKGAIVDATQLHRNTVGGRLPVLEAGDAVQCIHDPTALYELRSDPREESEEETGRRNEPTPQAVQDCHEVVLRARSRLEDVLDAMDRNDGQAARRAAEDVLETLNKVDV